MNIKDKLKRNKIEKILIIDDSLENLKAAKGYFSKLELDVDYIQSPKEAKEKIKKGFYSKDKYSLVITDMEMDDKNSGLEISEYAFQHCILPLIVTGKNYNAPLGAAHGPNTSIIPLNKSIAGKKNKEEVWEGIFENSLEYLDQKEGKSLHNSLERYFKFIGKPINKKFAKFYKERDTK